jgi:very-short-patch-repair endonuclease
MTQLVRPSKVNTALAQRLKYRLRPLLSRGEFAFFTQLMRAVAGRWGISIKTRLADLIACETISRDETEFRRISQKHVDFVVYDWQSARAIAVIELDDQSHAASDRAARDEFVDSALRCAGLRVIRVNASREYPVAVLRRYLDLALQQRRTANRMSPRRFVTARQRESK